MTIAETSMQKIVDCYDLQIQRLQEKLIELKYSSTEHVHRIKAELAEEEIQHTTDAIVFIQNQRRAYVTAQGLWETAFPKPAMLANQCKKPNDAA